MNLANVQSFKIKKDESCQCELDPKVQRKIAQLKMKVLWIHTMTQRKIHNDAKKVEVEMIIKVQTYRILLSVYENHSKCDNSSTEALCFFFSYHIVNFINEFNWTSPTFKRIRPNRGNILPFNGMVFILSTETISICVFFLLENWFQHITVFFCAVCDIFTRYSYIYRRFIELTQRESEVYSSSMKISSWR